MLSMVRSRRGAKAVVGLDRVGRRSWRRWMMVAMVAGMTGPAFASIDANRAGTDSDKDGLSDAMEQVLLERFVPRFRLSAGECDERPAWFAEDVRRATALRRNGTIYGQVTPRGKDARGQALIEVHYYDPWSKDCGRKGHVLDAEHVSVLLTAERGNAPASEWRARYWFAAAHEATMCDMSQVATGVSLRAEVRGPEVWISAGKHAAYLTEAICNGGCGADRCARSEPLSVEGVVNLGEAGRPMHGATWVEDVRWPMRAKMETDFPPAALARLERQEFGAPVLSNGAHGSVRGTIYVANATYGGLATGAANTTGALGTADDRTAGALATSRDETFYALGRSARNVRSALGKAAHAMAPGERKPKSHGSQ